MYDYKDKLIVVTGASSGLGRHLSEAYHAAGARLALVARRKDMLEDLAREWDPAGNRVRCFPTDLLRISEIPDLISQITDTFGSDIDVMVHCGGASCYGELERIPFEAMEEMTRVNYLAGIRLVQSVVEPMKRQGHGQIIWIGSGSAFRGVPRAAAYSASKAAAKTFCEALRSELHEFGIDVLLVIPGALKTDFHQNQANYSSDQRLRSTGTARSPAGLAAATLSAGRRRRSLLIYGYYAWLGQHLAYWAPWRLDRIFRQRLK